MRIWPCAVCLLLALSVRLHAQSTCPLPPALKPVSAGANIFSEQQESDLGDAIAESIAKDLHIVRDESATAHLQETGERLVKYLPPTQFRYRFFLVDLSLVNAFSLPGGRVYISRKVVALAQNDDELAGVLAHELGHIVTRQLGVTMTQMFRTVIGVTKVGDRADIYNKYFQYLDSFQRKPPRPETYQQEEEHQYIADQVALFAMARAGYDPHAYVDVLDRMQQTHGKSGNWFSDLFGTTTPQQHRLRELLKNIGTMSAACAEVRSATDVSAFRQWQMEVVGSQAMGLEESIPGLVSKTALALPLRPDIMNLRFSPDAKYVLAQDDGGIHVLSRDPLTVLFFIDAPDAYKAGFSPDSTQVIFYTRSFRVEVWDIASHKRVSVHEILVTEPCLQWSLSPDGRFFGCFRQDFSLSLMDVNSGETLVNKRNFMEIRSFLGWFVLLELLATDNPDLIRMRFSPDGQYFLAGSRSTTLTYDLNARHEASLPGSIRSAIQNPFTFTGTGILVGVNPYSGHKSPVLRFPSGEKLGELPLNGGTHVSSVTHGDYVMVSPLKEAPMGAMDLNKRELFMSFKHEAADLYDNWVLTERMDGEIGISEISPMKLVARVQLNQSRLGSLQAVAVSPDFSHLAVSTRSRGAVWDLSRNIRTHLTRAFEGGWFGVDQSLYSKFGRTDKNNPGEPVSIGRLDVMGGASAAYSIKERFSRQAGPYLFVFQPTHDNGPEQKDCKVELRDYRTQKNVWSRYFPREVPEMGIDDDDRLLLGWRVALGGGDELQKYPELKGRAEKEDYFFEVVDPAKDSVVAKLLVKTNRQSFGIAGVTVQGSWAAVRANSDRILLFDLTTGEERAHVFGENVVISTAAGQFAVTDRIGDLELRDLATGASRRQYQFPVPVAFQRFSPDGKRLFVLTRDQTAYVLDLTAPSE